MPYGELLRNPSSLAPSEVCPVPPHAQAEAIPSPQVRVPQCPDPPEALGIPKRYNELWRVEATEDHSLLLIHSHSESSS